MYCYFFDRYYGHDRVAWVAGLRVNPGDFFEIVGVGYVICLGDKISWSEQYTKCQEPKLLEAELLMICKKMLGEGALELLHRFTNQWFCVYKKAVPLWIADPEEVAKRYKKTSRGKKMQHAFQTLSVYPTLWALENDQSIDRGHVLVLHSQSTKKQKAEAFWGIRAGGVKHIACTYSQIFQDWRYLDEVVVYSPDSRYYKNAQDPRYHAVDVLDRLLECDKCKI